jgi:hypothetical protein
MNLSPAFFCLTTLKDMRHGLKAWLAAKSWTSAVIWRHG